MSDNLRKPEFAYLTWQEQNFQLLGRKTLWWRITIPFAWLLWKLSVNDLKKSWKAYNLGRISHKHKFDGAIVTIMTWKFNTCVHYGCNEFEDHDLKCSVDTILNMDTMK